MDNRSGTHRAGLFRNVESTVGEAPIPYRLLSLGQRQHLGVRGGVLEEFNLVKSARDDPPGADHDGADWHLFRGVSPARLAQSLAHEVMIALEVNDRFIHNCVFEMVFLLVRQHAFFPSSKFHS